MASPSSPISILHTNDFHGALTPAKADFIKRLKQEHNALYFDTGDCIKTGNLGIPLKREPAWDLLDRAGCDAGVLGNRETHVLQSAFKAKIEGAKHPILCANLRLKDNTRPLPEHIFFERNGLRIAVFAVMVPMVTERMATKSASAYLWDPPIPTAKRKTKELRNQADLLIALTHIGFKQDQELAGQCPEIDIILGGHSHTMLQEPVKIGKTYICQGGSHGRLIGVYEFTAGGKLNGGLTSL